MTENNVIKWTRGQQSAINSRNSTLLVSAAAGSGKTAVLTNRIIEKIINDKCEITDFLVVTFTRAAASEMKNKITRALRNKISQNPSDRHLRRQIMLIDQAKISTIDSFCMSLIKENFNLLALPAGIRIMDESESKVFLKRKTEEVLEKFYKKYDNIPGSDFHIVVETLSGDRDDRRLLDTLSNIYKMINAYPQPVKLLETLNVRIGQETDECRAGKMDIFDTVWGGYFQKYTLRRLEQADECLNLAMDLCYNDTALEEKYLPALKVDKPYIEALYAAVKSGDYIKARNWINSYSPTAFGRVVKCEDEYAKQRVKKLREAVKDTIKGLQTELFCYDRETIFEQCEKTCKMGGIIVDMVRELMMSDREEKIQKSIIDFSDLSHLTFEALVREGTFDYQSGSFEKTPLAEKLTGEFTEIFIDEYQDTNLLQDAIFNAISNGHNLFMVGDLKQSIYRFRGADPSIFRKYKDGFEYHTEKTTTEKQKIFLSENFRSNRGVLDFVNRLFSDTMNILSPDSYIEEDMLVCTKSDQTIVPELHLFNKNGGDSDEDYGTVGEAEWEYIAYEIIRLCKGKYSYGDIAVLARDSKELLKIKAVLDSHGVPCITENRESLFDRSEILVMLCILNTIDNPRRDMYLIGAMTSPFFCFTSDELYSIRLFSDANSLLGAGNDCFLSAVDYYRQNKNDTLSEKINAFLEMFEKWREYSTEVGVSALIRKIYNDTSALSVMNTHISRDNLISFYDFAKEFEKKDLKGLFVFITYINDIIENGHSVNVPQQNGDTVHLMTMHKSKGLEFPVCFVSALSKKMNTRDIYGNLIINKEIGISLRHSDAEGIVVYDTLHRRVSSILEKNKQYEEEMRLLYVALTRAKERLILTASVPESKISPFGAVTVGYDISKALTLYDFISASLRSDPCYCDLSPEKTVYSEKLALNVILHDCFVSPDSYIEKNEIQEKEIHSIAPDDIIFEYDNTKFASVPQKLSVSQLHLGLTDDTDDKQTVFPYSAPAFISGREHNYAAAKGTAMHTFVQFCDYEISARKGCEYEAQRLLREKFITQEQYEMLDFSKLDGFFRSELYNNKIKHSSFLRREMRFNILVDSEKIDNSAPGEKVLIQGVIDCFFRNPDGSYTVVDFKTDRLSDADEFIERHHTQLDFYSYAVSDMTGEKVSEKIIYSFELGKEIKL
ncbi:MAG: UvrD-helicase domain-containing protein [Clostridia bacterium]|nr:UvrD-helicase domain-containing protein [Clostridia bacterium]